MNIESRLESGIREIRAALMSAQIALEQAEGSGTRADGRASCALCGQAICDPHVPGCRIHEALSLINALLVA